MSLSLHSSSEALTSSKRGLEKDSDMDPEKSSIGEISPRISSSPDCALGSPETRLRQASLPISQSNDSVCRARRLGTSRGSRILAKEIRRGAPGIPERRAVAVVVVPGRETAKMRPSEDRRRRCTRSPQRPGRRPGKEALDEPAGGQRAAQTSSVAETATAVEDVVVRYGRRTRTVGSG